MSHIISLCLLVVSTTSMAQLLTANSIKQHYKEDANVVVRNSLLEFEVFTLNKAIETYSVELTILNETGKREATQYVYHSDLQKILEVSGEIYNAQGRLVKKIKKSEIEDVSASGNNMYTDNRLNVLDFSYPSYPYSIRFEYKVQYDGLMFSQNGIPKIVITLLWKRRDLKLLFLNHLA